MSETALLAKLHRVAQAINNIEKNGRNDHQHYDFVRAVDVVRKVRDLLYDEDVIVVPAAGNARHEAAIGGRGMVTTVDLGYTFRDIHNPEVSVSVPWVGVGADVGGDKGIYKAYTGGLKYALLSLFLIPTGDDPEGDEITESESKAHKDDERPPAPRIPVDRARAILEKAVEVGMAKLPSEEHGQGPLFEAVFQAVLAQHGVEKIGSLNVDQAEAVEAFLTAEAGS